MLSFTDLLLLDFLKDKINILVPCLVLIVILVNVYLSLNSLYIIQRFGNVFVTSLQKEYCIKIKSWEEILSFH